MIGDRYLIIVNKVIIVHHQPRPFGSFATTYMYIANYFQSPYKYSGRPTFMHAFLSTRKTNVPVGCFLLTSLECDDQDQMPKHQHFTAYT